MIYLASPYSHPDFGVMVTRHDEAMAYTHYLLERERWVYSPIVHCHELARRHKLPTDHTYWKRYNYHMLARADEVHVLALEGWRDSLGVRSELEFWSALKHNARALWITGKDKVELIYDVQTLLEMMDGIRG